MVSKTCEKLGLDNVMATVESLTLPAWPGLDLSGLAGRVPESAAVRPGYSIVAPDAASMLADMDPRLGIPGAIVLAIRPRPGDRVQALALDDGLIGDAQAAIRCLAGQARDRGQGFFWLTLNAADAAWLMHQGQAALPAGALDWSSTAQIRADLASVGELSIVLCLGPLTSSHVNMGMYAQRIEHWLRLGDNSKWVILQPSSFQLGAFANAITCGSLRRFVEDNGRREFAGVRPAGSLRMAPLRLGLPAMDAYELLSAPADGRLGQASLRITSIEPAVEIPITVSAEYNQVRQPAGCNSWGRFGEMLSNLNGGARHKLPAELSLALLDVAPAEWRERLVDLIYQEALPPVSPGNPREKAKVTRPHFPVTFGGFYPMCRASGLLLDQQGGVAWSEPVELVLVESPPLKAGDQVVAAVRAVIHPTTGRRVLVAESFERLDPPAQAEPPALALRRVMQPFMVSADLGALTLRAELLGRDLAAAFGLAGQQAGLMAIMTALVHCSPLRVELPTGRVLAYGPLQALILGPPASHKTTMAGGLTKRIGLAALAVANNLSRADLFFSRSDRKTRPGLMPANDGGLLFLDEVHKIDREVMSFGTDARSQGTLSAAGLAMPMRTRFLVTGNLCQRQGSRHVSSVSLAQLGEGILGCCFLEPEDIRRFDLVLITSREAAMASDKPLTDGQETVELLRQLVDGLWKHSRQAGDHYLWGEGAYAAAVQADRTLRAKYETPSVPIFGPDSLDKICRLAAAAARLMPVHCDGMIHITAAHVGWAAQFMGEIYELPACGLARIARRDAAAAAGPAPEDMDDLLASLAAEHGPKWELILKAFGRHPQQTTAELAGRIGVSIRTAVKRVKALSDAKLITTHGRAGLRATPRLLQLCRYWERLAATKGQDAPPEDSAEVDDECPALRPDWEGQAEPPES